MSKICSSIIPWVEDYIWLHSAARRTTFMYTYICRLSDFIYWSLVYIFLAVVHLSFVMTLKLFCLLTSAKLLNSHYKRVVYITGILTGIFITIVPSIVNTVLSNYQIITFPPVQCGNSSRTYHFYTVTIPVMTTVCVCGILMSLTLYKIATCGKFDGVGTYIYMI